MFGPSIVSAGNMSKMLLTRESRLVGSIKLGDDCVYFSARVVERCALVLTGAHNKQQVKFHPPLERTFVLTPSVPNLALSAMLIDGHNVLTFDR